MKTETRWFTLLFLGFILLLASSLIACGCPAPPPSLPTIAASPSSFSFVAKQGEANPSSQTLGIQNSGEGTLDWSAIDDADWLNLSLTSGSCSSGETDDVTVSVDVTGMTNGDYSATITISAPEASNSPQEVPVNLTITPITPTVTYAVSVTVSAGSQTGLPDDTLDYTVTVTNMGTAADTYDLGISDDYGWTLTCPPATSAIVSGESENIIINLTIPEDAVPETEDEITIIATSQNDPTVSDSATCTAVVIEEEQPPPVTPVSISISPSSTTISPGDTFTIEVVVDSADTPITACNVTITFDGDDLAATGTTGTDLLGTSGLDAFYLPLIDVGEVSYGGVRLPAAGPMAVNDNFVTIDFAVDAAAAGTYDLVVAATLHNAAGNPIAVVENDGLVIVQ